MKFFFNEIRKARSSQVRRKWRDTRTQKRLDALQDRFEKPVQVSLVKGITTLKSNISRQAVYDAWMRKDYGLLMKELKWDELPKSLKTASDWIERGADASAEYAIEALPSQINENLRFSTNNPRLQGLIRDRVGGLIVNVTDDIQQLVQNSVTQGFDMALTPRQIANQIVGSIGLYPQLQTALQNYREKLASDGVSEDEVERLAGDYEERLLDYRAMTIARTEVKTASNFGQLSVWEEGQAQGLLDPETTRKVWLCDVEPCKVCKPMDGKTAPINGTWLVKYPNGDFMNVDVPNQSHPNCLCEMAIEFGDSQDKLDGKLFDASGE